MTPRLRSALAVASLLACTPDAGSGATTDDATATTDDAEAGSESGDASESESESESSTQDTGETDDSTDTDTDTDTDPRWLSDCPEVLGAQSGGFVTNDAISEASGLIRSRTQDLVWVHNDSGDTARLFALTLPGLASTEFVLAGASAVDWEDLAMGPGPEPGDYLYVGDIGDNAEARPGITVYRVPEPQDVARVAGHSVDLANWEAIELSYPDGAHNAETLLVDPITGDLFIVTKGLETRLYRRAAPLSSGPLELLADPNFPSAIATAGDVSPLGDFVIVRGYIEAFAWLRGPDQTLAEALTGEPCMIPLAAEQQGETLAIDADGRGYATLSEGTDQTLWQFRFAP